MDRWITSPTWGPPTPCKQALSLILYQNSRTIHKRPPYIPRINGRLRKSNERNLFQEKRFVTTTILPRNFMLIGHFDTIIYYTGYNFFHLKKKERRERNNIYKSKVNFIHPCSTCQLCSK